LQSGRAINPDHSYYTSKVALDNTKKSMFGSKKASPKEQRIVTQPINNNTKKVKSNQVTGCARKKNDKVYKSNFKLFYSTQEV
jgi:hypothetical protein